jgi:uncharacterized protein YdaU (DUF1376 family)
VHYYEHHIRDYDTDTAHLSWEEDLAYTRLLRWYYRKEEPIPADLKEACRQVRALTKAQKDAVAAVLKEFFELREDGWHHDTCDEIILEYKEGEPQRELKKANEDNRTKKHREERSRLFKVLTDAGQHAAWNISITELRALVSKLHVTAPVTEIEEPVTQPVTATDTLVTATHKPLTINQYIKTPTKESGGNNTTVGQKTFRTSLPRDFGISPEVELWAKTKGYAADLPAYLEVFVLKVKANGYERDDWDSFFKTSMLQDWGEVRKNGKSGGGKTALEMIEESEATNAEN